MIRVFTIFVRSNNHVQCRNCVLNMSRKTQSHLVNAYTKEEVESLRILLYTSANVHIVKSTVEIKRSQWVKARKSAWSTVKMLKRAGQSFDLLSWL